MSENYNRLIQIYQKVNSLTSTPLCVVKSSGLGGRGLFATRDISCGETIFVDRPLLLGPRTEKSCNLFCVSCYKTDNLETCSRHCGLPLCGRKCEDSSCHRRECDFIAERRRNKFDEINCDVFRYLTPIRAFLLDQTEMKLLQLLQRRSGKRGFEASILKEHLNLDEEEERFLNCVCSILDTNTFEITKGSDLSLKALYPLSSMLNHSCVPNTAHYFDSDQNMIVKANVPIKKDKEILHCYTKLFWGTCVRQTYLLKTKHFFCSCLRCQDETEFGTYLSAINCFNCEGVAVPTRKNSKFSWTCVTCKTALDDSIAGMVLAILGSRLNNLSSANPQEILQFLNGRLLKYAPISSQIAVQLKCRLIWLLGYTECYHWEDLSVELLLEKETICRDLLNLLETLRAGKNKMRGLLLYELYCCLKEKQKRLLEQQSETQENKIKEIEIQDLLEESKEILKDDVHAPPEIQSYFNGQ